LIAVQNILNHELFIQSKILALIQVLSVTQDYQSVAILFDYDWENGKVVHSYIKLEQDLSVEFGMSFFAHLSLIHVFFISDAIHHNRSQLSEGRIKNCRIGG
jgi:hypothetical protein